VRSDLSAHADLFALGWVRDPEAAVAAANALGISEPYAIEVSAWCAELHEQLRRLADERDVPLLLMGGQGASMRLEAERPLAGPGSGGELPDLRSTDAPGAAREAQPDSGALLRAAALVAP